MYTGQLIMLGGPIMIPIMICSVIAIGIIIEKLFYFSKIKINAAEFKNKLFEQIKQNQFKSAIQICNTNPSPLAKVFKAGILKFGESRETIKQAMEDVSLLEIPELEKHFPALATIAHLSPLLGLLGTVLGLATCFHSIQTRTLTMNPVTPGDLAGGVWEALLTTIAGLSIAIITYVAYNYLVSRLNSMILEIERGGTELENVLCQLSENKSVSSDFE